MITGNVKITLAYTVIQCVAVSIALNSIFSNYVYLITDGSNSKVGYITGLNGLATVAVAPLCGYWADKHRRDWMLRVAGIVGILVAIATMVGVIQGNYAFLCACLVGWGIYGGIQSPSMEALFADSVEPGERSRVFTLKYALVQAAFACGPLCSLVMFHYLGDEWAIPQCQHVIIAGLILALFPSILCFLFDDDKVHLSHSPLSIERTRRQREREARRAARRERRNRRRSTVLNVDDAGGASSFFGATGAGALTEPLLDGDYWDEAEDVVLGEDDDDADDREQGEAEAGGAQLRPPPPQQQQTAATSRGCGCCRAKEGSFCFHNFVPCIIVLTDVCFGLASGMSVRFFPLFFMESYDLSPMMVSLIYFISPLATSLSSFCAQRISQRAGRVGTTIGFKFAGVSLLFLMCWLDFIHYSAALVVPVFIARTALMNSTKPLTRSIIMDFVPKEQRAKWNSLESVTGATWAGSAVVGGLLVDRFGFLINNVATASLQLLSTLPLFLVLGMVRHEHEAAAAGGDSNAEASDEDDEEEEDAAALDASQVRKALFFNNSSSGDAGGRGDGSEGLRQEEEEERSWARHVAAQLAWLRGKLAARHGKEGGEEEDEAALDAPLEEEADLGRLERLLKGESTSLTASQEGRV